MFNKKHLSVTGRWSGKGYSFQKKLGAGGIGEIYLVKDDFGKAFAMKVSRDLISITKEYGYLKRFDNMSFAPKAYELDDCEVDSVIYHFFIMEYVEGETLRETLSKERLTFGNKLDIVIIITDVLKSINSQGFVYTDLKYENIMVDKKNGLVRLIDFGSITPVGDRVKEYTKMYDRGSWKAGSRTADLSYQVFGIMILLISMLLSRDINPEKESLDQVQKQLERNNLSGDLKVMIKNCIEGRIADCDSLCYRLGKLCRNSYSGRKLTYALDSAIACLSVLLLVLLRTVFAL